MRPKILRDRFWTRSMTTLKTKCLKPKKDSSDVSQGEVQVSSDKLGAFTNPKLSQKGAETELPVALRSSHRWLGVPVAPLKSKTSPWVVAMQPSSQQRKAWLGLSTAWRQALHEKWPVQDSHMLQMRASLGTGIIFCYLFPSRRRLQKWWSWLSPQIFAGPIFARYRSIKISHPFLAGHWYEWLRIIFWWHVIMLNDLNDGAISSNILVLRNRCLQPRVRGMLRW